MLLYHGSNKNIENINLAMCKPYKDFGRGFYLTELKEQAEKMAIRVAKIHGGIPVVNIYEIADDDMVVLFRQYQNGMINFDMLVKGMTYKDITSQCSFHSEKAICLLKKVGVIGE